ncbi:FAD binding domain-containing protein [Microbacterium rhizomatis]|uniref:FAD-binding molybdopterin dehydrogenase n=1 Tax=Microbacterium rhizomatis TaxID=1631477 RepID=A0A5J5J286_9MICO|nr:FAD binding domain-containing protein [Microbacterium rhizomatis]KAA9106398.1 FAD-binding molybdopterin dehydrogenase [Microbacterium rhizomatis]
MDINTVTSFRSARTRTDLALAPGEVFIAGGTWLMSEPQPATTGFVDLTTLDWPDIEVSEAGLRIGATCTIARLLAWSKGEKIPDAAPRPAEWTALDIVPDAADALLASFKIWNTATIGGNLGRAFCAGAMISLTAGLDGTALIWRPDGTERTVAVADFPTGNGTHVLERGEVVRAIDLPSTALRGRALLRKIALAELGRSGAVVTARRDEDGSSTFVITAATLTPQVLRFAGIPDAAALASAVATASGYYTDPLGPADWRRAVSAALAERLRRDLGGVA